MARSPKGKGQRLCIQWREQSDQRLRHFVDSSRSKNRATDDVSQLVAQKYRECWRPEFNEILVRDEHTSKGKGLGRKYRHWSQVGSKCKNLVGEEKIGGPTYKQEAEQIWEQLAQENGESEAEYDPDVERLGLK